MTGTQLIVKRWRRFGHDRLYVTAPDGEQVGWADLSTDQLHPTSPAHLGELSHAVAEWKLGPNEESGPHGHSPPAPLTPVRLEAEAPSSPPPSVRREVTESDPSASASAAVEQSEPEPEQVWTDLTVNGPGAEARARARELRDAAPVRTFFTRVLNTRTPERAWRIGADGEERVAVELAKLVQHDARWRVLHAIRVGDAGADIDHLVIGPGGVFTLNAKHHPRAALWVGGDTFMVNGQRQPYVRNSRHEARRAARLLTAASGVGTQVSGVIVPIGVRSLTIKTAPVDSAVVTQKQLVGWLRSRPQFLEKEIADTIWEVARRSTTWQSR